MIGTLLVANRGEIAARIFRTCDRLGIATVAVATPEDAGALHARQAEQTHEITSYLDPDAVINVAKAAGAHAIHPGYGFLAESADFAAAVDDAGIGWVGPPAQALRLAGDKIEAGRTAGRAGVPTVPTGTPDEIGFPLMVKAAAGGGGRGLRIVRGRHDLDAALEAARREAKAAFGDDRVYCEQLVESAHHVEVQLLADRHGQVLALGERDCSIQRRHQKIIEESPSPAVSEKLRELLSVYATSFARAVGYQSAGTAEFLVSGDGEVSFLELNARIQVEHPVTELRYDLDLIEWQLRIAVGEPLDVIPVPSGHAIEARLYAEHPLTFLPQGGRVTALRLPAGVRADPGVEAGDEIPLAYDPMIAKLIAHGDSRAAALETLSAALDEAAVEGVTTNLSFLRWALRHPVVKAGAATTAFLDEHPPLSRLHPVPRVWRGRFRLNGGPGDLPESPRPAPTVERTRSRAPAAGGEAMVSAPMPGSVVSVLVSPGATVAAREPLLVLEAMKMETPVVAPYAATVQAVNVAEGDQVAAGQTLVHLE